MSEKKVATPIALAIGIALAGSFAAVEAAQADTGVSPFAMTTLSTAYMLGEAEGSCGGDKAGGEEKDAEGSCGGDKAGGEMKDAEGSCGGDKAGAEEKDAEGSCGGDKAGAEEKDAEGKCGEGKCGGSV